MKTKKKKNWKVVLEVDMSANHTEIYYVTATKRELAISKAEEICKSEGHFYCHAISCEVS